MSKIMSAFEYLEFHGILTINPTTMQAYAEYLMKMRVCENCKEYSYYCPILHGAMLENNTINVKTFGCNEFKENEG